MMSKGDNRRPQQVSDQVMQENWDRTFGEIATWTKKSGLKPQKPSGPNTKPE